MESRTIEVYVGYGSGFWATELLDVPKTTPDHLSEAELINLVVDQHCENKNCRPDIVFCGIYNENPLDDDSPVQ